MRTLDDVRALLQSSCTGCADKAERGPACDKHHAMMSRLLQLLGKQVRLEAAIGQALAQLEAGDAKGARGILRMLGNPG